MDTEEDTPVLGQTPASKKKNRSAHSSHLHWWTGVMTNLLLLTLNISIIALYLIFDARIMRMEKSIHVLSQIKDTELLASWNGTVRIFGNPDNVDQIIKMIHFF